MKYRRAVVLAAREMRRETAGFLRGQLLLSGMVGLLTGLGLLLVGTPGWLVLGVLMGIMELIPYIGPIIAGIPAGAAGAFGWVEPRSVDAGGAGGCAAVGGWLSVSANALRSHKALAADGAALHQRGRRIGRYAGNAAGAPVVVSLRGAARAWPGGKMLIVTTL